MYDNSIQGGRIQTVAKSCVAAGLRAIKARQNACKPVAKRPDVTDLCRYGQLALHIIKRKGFDPGDKVLTKSIGNRLIHVLRLQWKTGQLVTLV